MQTIVDFLYYIFLFPIEWIFACLLDFFLRFCPAGYSIILLAIVANIIYQPIAYLAKIIEDKEKKLQKIIKPKIAEIKKTYKGEEAFKKIDLVYKEHKYNILLSFRSSLSLLVMLPFFIAAVAVLNTNPLLQGKPFLIITNLALPDMLLFHKVNILPFIMFIFNIIAIKFSSQKNLLSKQNILLLSLAILFLVFLYNKSSALLLYWTVNNIISATKSFVINQVNQKRNFQQNASNNF